MNVPDDDFDPNWADHEMWVYRYTVPDWITWEFNHREIHERRADQPHPIRRARQLAEEHGVAVHFTSARVTANFNVHWTRCWSGRTMPLDMPLWHVVYPTGGRSGWRLGRFTVVDCPNRAAHGLPEVTQ